jgi:hypothetical protein
MQQFGQAVGQAIANGNGGAILPHMVTNFRLEAARASAAGDPPLARDLNILGNDVQELNTDINDGSAAVFSDLGQVGQDSQTLNQLCS